MENTTKTTANRGTRKTVTLLLMGDESAVIHPLYLHVSKGGYVRGVAIDKNRNAQNFALSIPEFHKTQLNVVKGLG